MKITRRQLRRVIRQAIIQESMRQFVGSLCLRRRVLREGITGAEILADIKKTLLIVKAKKVGGKAWEFVKGKFKDSMIDLALNSATLVPFLGSAAAGIKISKDMAKLGIEATLAANDMEKAAREITSIAAGEYAGMDDGAVGQNPLAKVFNLDDQMEFPLKDDYIKDFASKMAGYLADNPNVSFDSKEKAAEQMLSSYLENNPQTDWETAKGPS